MTVGANVWVIADGYIPPHSNGPEPAMTSHDSMCILNAGEVDAHVEILIFFTDREPSAPYTFTVPARRAHHQRFNNLQGSEPVPVDVDYCCLIRSDVPIVVQHTRLDSRQEANALMSTIAYPAG